MDEFLQKLADKIGSEDCSKEETAQFLEILHSLDEHSYKEVFNLLYEKLPHHITAPLDAAWHARLENRLDLVQGDTDAPVQQEEISGFSPVPEQEPAPVIGMNRRSPLKKMMGAAAVLIILLGSGWWWISVKYKPGKNQNTIAAIKAKDIAPGTNKAVLTLGDGSTIQLDSASAKNDIKQGNTIIRQRAGQLSYSAKASPAPDAIMFNTLTTPYGGRYSISLPDGTRVWLNAVSSLKYPAAFTGDTRVVELTGEAYFEVETLQLRSGQKMPFIVRTPHMDISVLGTHFNVMAYGDEETTSATLLEGSVMVKAGETMKKLIPGQQAELNKSNNKLKVEEVDTEAVVAWKDGLFTFNGEDIYKIMRQISRWYNVKVDFEEGLSKRRIKGQLFSNMNLSEVLAVLELSGFHFRLKERELTVVP